MTQKFTQLKKKRMKKKKRGNPVHYGAMASHSLQDKVKMQEDAPMKYQATQGKC